MRIPEALPRHTQRQDRSRRRLGESYAGAASADVREGTRTDSTEAAHQARAAPGHRPGVGTPNGVAHMDCADALWAKNWTSSSRAGQSAGPAWERQNRLPAPRWEDWPTGIAATTASGVARSQLGRPRRPKPTGGRPSGAHGARPEGAARAGRERRARAATEECASDKRAAHERRRASVTSLMAPARRPHKV